MSYCPKFDLYCHCKCGYNGRCKTSFCEVEKENLGISPKRIKSLISKNTKAIIPVHLYGYPCKMDEILKISKEFKIKIIEDAAQGKSIIKTNMLVPMEILAFYPIMETKQLQQLKEE